MFENKNMELCHLMKLLNINAESHTRQFAFAGATYKSTADVSKRNGATLRSHVVRSASIIIRRQLSIFIIHYLRALSAATGKCQNKGTHSALGHNGEQHKKRPVPCFRRCHLCCMWCDMIITLAETSEREKSRWGGWERGPPLWNAAGDFSGRARPRINHKIYFKLTRCWLHYAGRPLTWLQHFPKFIISHLT